MKPAAHRLTLVLCALLAACGTKAPAPATASVAEPPPNVADREAPMRSYVTRNANSGRNGSVRLPRLAPVGLTEVVKVEPEGKKTRVTPFVLTAPEGKRILVQQASRGRLYSLGGALLDGELGRSLDNAHLDAAGFFSRDALLPYDDAANSALKAKRPDPSQLHPGDDVEVPDSETKTEEAPTGQRTRFYVGREKTFLKLRLRYRNVPAPTG